MNAVEIIIKKRNGGKLTRDEIEYFVSNYISGGIKDYQMSALLMSIYLNGMDFEETGWLTEVMLFSGDVVEFPEPDNIYVDKHSTGGVGDKISLILAPLAAACGLKVPMLSGRGLGHTGGTLDKLESIPGFRTDLTLDEFKNGVETVGCVITGQTPKIAPADKLIYALRDVTGTIESIPLICGSILSKKFAAGPKGLVFDVKCGNGAFMRNRDSAEELAANLINVCKAMNKTASALITDMNQPLGRNVGNYLEVMEVIDFLRGNQAEDVYNISIGLIAEMLIVSGAFTDYVTAENQIKQSLENGSAYSKFAEMVEYQGGDLSEFDNLRSKANVILEYKSLKDGYITGFDTYSIGRLIVEMGGGRMTKDDVIDPYSGLVFHKKIGDSVKNGDILVEIHAKNQEIADILGFSIDTAKIRLHRARAKLKKMFEEGCDFYRDEDGKLACDRKQKKSENHGD